MVNDLRYIDGQARESIGTSKQSTINSQQQEVPFYLKQDRRVRNLAIQEIQRGVAVGLFVNEITATVPRQKVIH